MKEAIIIRVLLCILMSTNSFAYSLQKTLSDYYQAHCSEISDIYEHLPTLYTLSKECSSITEIGVRSMISTWAFLKGLSENQTNMRSYLGIDLYYPEKDIFNHAKKLSKDNDISFNFWQTNDMLIELLYTDMLFIDSLHTYRHLTYELEKFCNSVGKYIVLHDTSGPFGTNDQIEYDENYLKYPAYIDCNKRGLWQAAVDFLDHHPEWTLMKRYLNNNGLTILKRV